MVEWKKKENNYTILTNKSLPNKILLQAKEGLDPKGAFKKSFSEKYLLFKNLLRSEEGDARIFQACLARTAWLKISISLKLIPPRSLGTQSLSQLSQCIFHLSSWEHHQKESMADVKFLQVVFGSLKQLIAWIGIARATNFKIIFFPAWERNLLYQPDIPPFNLSWI